MKIEFSQSFKKEYKNCPPKIKETFKKRLDMLMKNKFDPMLNNHQLKGKLLGYRSINITGDWRAIYEEYDDTFYFIILGPHSRLYL